MTKNVWVQPRTVVQQFVANEYVASSCGESGTTYLFECNAGQYRVPIIGTTISLPGTVYVDTNGNGQLDDGDEDLTSGAWLGGYKACNKTHTAPASDEFVRGFYKPLDIGYFTQDVIIWTEGGTNVHCTTNLNREDWETAKS